MATLQKSSEKGYRIHWRLYLPNGTNTVGIQTDPGCMAKAYDCMV